MQEETEVLGENLRGRAWIDNQIHIQPWPDRESNPGCSGKRQTNDRGSTDNEPKFSSSVSSSEHKRWWTQERRYEVQVILAFCWVPPLFSWVCYNMSRHQMILYSNM